MLFFNVIVEKQLDSLFTIIITLYLGFAL